jgi:hypothetical protein
MAGTFEKKRRKEQIAALRREVETMRAAEELEAKPLWRPFPGRPQELAYNSPANEILFGGSAGAGKTGLAVGLALTRHRRSLILRREAVQVPEIVEQLKRFSEGRGKWSGKGYGGTLTTDDGRTVEVGGCEHEDDWIKYKGRPHDLIVFDEATDFTNNIVRYISAWNRHEDPKQPCKVLLPTNPPTSPEGRFIVEMYAPWLSSEYPDPAKPGEIRWYSTLEGKDVWRDGPEPFEYKGETVKPRSRTFIPGRLSDNPILAATDYGARLQALPEPLRSQLLYGAFDLKEADNPYQVIPTAWLRAAMARWKPGGKAGLKMTRLGVDVARAGADRTTICPRYGEHYFDKILSYPGAETADGQAVAALVMRAHQDNAEVYIDVVGPGASAFDILKENSWLTVKPINNAEAKIIAHRRDRSGRLKFKNVRAFSYWQLREMLDPDHGTRLEIPPDNELLSELCAVRWKLTSGGAIQLEDKDEVIKRISRSPDLADAFVLAAVQLYRAPQGMRTIHLNQTPVSGAKRAERVILSGGALEASIAEGKANVLVVSVHETVSTTQLDHVPEADLITRLHFHCPRVDPRDYRADWGQALAILGGQTPMEAGVQLFECRRIVKEVTVNRPTRFQTLLVLDEGDGSLALSVACGLADCLSLPRQQIWHKEQSQPPVKPEPPLEYVCRKIKEARSGMV